MNRDIISLDEMNCRGIGLELLHNLWVILLAAAAVWLGATGLGKLFHSPEYTASATLVVSEKGTSSAYSSLTLTTQMAGVFQEVFQSDVLRTLIAEDTGKDIQGTITCEQIAETNLLVLKTTASDPRQAYLFIHSALANYEDVSGYVFANASLEIVQEPTIPSSPSNSSRLINNRILLTFLGAVGMAAVIILFYLFRFTVKTSISAGRQLDGKIQGIIPFEKKGYETHAGKRPWERKNKKALLISSPLVSMDYSEAGRRVEARIEHHMLKRGQKVLLVTSVGENEGKSTVAANLALGLAEKHLKVMLIDGDFRKPAQYKVFDCNKNNGISLDEVLRGMCDWKEAARRDEQNCIWELFQYKAVPNAPRLMTGEALNDLIEKLRREMDYIIIDCPPTAAAADAEIWMQVADTAVLVVREDWSDVRVINDTVDMIWQSCEDFGGFVLNAFREKGMQSKKGYGYRYGGYDTLESQQTERG